MKRSILLSPHISRLFSACLWFLLSIFIAINVFAKFTFQPSLFNTLPILLQPFSSQPHVAFAQILWSHGYGKEAKNEAKLAQVLGATDQITPLLSDWESEPKKAQEGYDKWKRITLEKPDYADAFLLTAIYTYQLGNNSDAIKIAHQASTLNPNSEVIREFSSALQ